MNTTGQGFQAKRTKGQRELDLVFISNCYVRGDSQYTIRDKLNAQREYALSRQMISKDIGVIQSRWQQEACRSIGQRKAEELAKIDNLEREYWEAWERSRKPAQEKFGKMRTKSGTGTETTDEKGVREKGRDGDPKFLDGVRWCIAQRCKILGLEVFRAEISGPEGEAVRVEDSSTMPSLSPDRLRVLIAALEQGIKPIDVQTKVVAGNGHKQIGNNGGQS